MRSPDVAEFLLSNNLKQPPVQTPACWFLHLRIIHSSKSPLIILASKIRKAVLNLEMVRFRKWKLNTDILILRFYDIKDIKTGHFNGNNVKHYIYCFSSSFSMFMLDI